MTAPGYIQDGRGSKSLVQVDPAGAMCIYDTARPPFSDVATGQPMRVFRQHLTDDGLITDGTNQDMRVDGSSTNVDFYVPASNTKDRYIRRLDFLIADPGAANNEFGALTALSNGCVLEYEDEMGVVTIHDAITTNFELVRLCGGEPAFGQTTNTFRASNMSGSAEGYFPQLDLQKTFGFAWGIRLKRGSTQRITFRIRDNLGTGLTQMDCIAYGFEME